MDHRGVDGPLLLAGIVLVHVGALMVKLFWFPRRSGKGRHCGKCNYILDGIDGDRCPECGQFLAGPDAVVRGRRVRRRGWAAAGLAVFVLGVTACAISPGGGLRNVNWYAYKPTAWVISDLGGGERAERDRAWRELSDRLARGKVSESQQAALDAASIRVLVKAAAKDAPPDAVRQRLVDRYALLTPEQKAATLGLLLADYFSPYWLSTLRARAQVNQLVDANLVSPSQIKRPAGPTPPPPTPEAPPRRGRTPRE